MDSKLWEKDLLKNCESFNTKSIKNMKCKFNKSCKCFSKDVVSFGKISLATIVIMPIMFGGVVYSIFTNDTKK